MSTTSELKGKFEKMRDLLNETRKEEYEIIVRDAVALLKKRVINTGVDGQGQKFPLYSRAVVPVWYFKGKDGVTQSNINTLYQTIGYFASYHDLRQVKGLPVNIKNFSFTNKMWNSLDAVVLSESDGKVVLGFVARSDREKVVNIHNDQSDILEFAQDEQTLILELSRKRILNKAKEAGL